MNVFEAVKQSVTTRQAASYYGIRVGRNGMACCPFHNDRTPSMKVDSRYYCFGCGASGDVIDFAASLHGLENGMRRSDWQRIFQSPMTEPSAHRQQRERRPSLRRSRGYGRRNSIASKCYVTICIYWNAGKSNMLHSHRMPPGILFSWKHCKKTAM